MTANALRLRRFRAREAQGLAVLSIEVDFNALSAALQEAGFLREDQIDDRAAVAAAAGRVLRLVCETRFLPDAPERR